MRNTIVTAIFLTLFTFNIQAGEIPFAAPQTIGAMDDVKDVFPADLDGDGDLDLVVTGAGIEWHENGGGAGAWTEHVIVASFAGDHVTAVDLDGDGDLDVLGSSAPDDIQWFENLLGDATTWTAHFVGGSTGGYVATGDLDGDGNLDIASEGGWWKKLGDGITGSKFNLSASGYGIAIGDIDGDGDNDIVGADDESDGLWWAVNESGDAGTMTVYAIDPLTAPFSV